MKIKIVDGEVLIFYGPFEGKKYKKKRKEKERKKRRALELSCLELTVLFDSEYAVCRNSLK